MATPAQKNTGPKTAPGKATASRNPLKRNVGSPPLWVRSEYSRGRCPPPPQNENSLLQHAFYRTNPEALCFQRRHLRSQRIFKTNHLWRAGPKPPRMNMNANAAYETNPGSY